MKSKSSLLEMVRLIVDPGDEIINGALAQDAGQASVALDGGVMDLDDHLCSQLDHLIGGSFGFISSNKFMRSNYGKSLRQYLMNGIDIREVVDFWGTSCFC